MKGVEHGPAPGGPFAWLAVVEVGSVSARLRVRMIASMAGCGRDLFVQNR